MHFVAFSNGLTDPPYFSIYHGSPDDATLTAYYEKAATLWKAVGIFVAGPLPMYLAQRNAPYFGGEMPGEADCELFRFSLLFPHSG